MRKIGVVGAGAIGGVLAAYFARAGFATSVVARGAHLQAIHAKGIQITAPTEQFSAAVHASDDPAAFGVQDVLFIGLKAHQIPAMLPRLLPMIGPQTLVVPAINGIPWWYFYCEGGSHAGTHIDCIDRGGAAMQQLDSRHLVGCVVYAAAEVVAPGEIRSNGNRLFHLGEPDGSLSPRLRALGEAMTRAGHTPKLTQRIRDEIWVKLIGNTSFNPIAALTRANLHQICDNPALIALIRSVMEEMNHVCAAYGIPPLVSIDRRLEMARAVGPVKSSMLQDLERGRSMEIEPLVGAVVELAGRVKIAVPNIELLYGMIRELDKNLQTA